MRLPLVPCLLIVITSHAVCPLTAGEPAKKSVPCQGTLQANGKTYKFDKIAVYETKIFDDDGYSVLVSDKTIPVDKLKAALKDGKGSDDKFIWFESQIKITFDKEGKPKFFNAYADNFSMSASSSSLKGELKIKDGQAQGTAAYNDSDKKYSFDITFDTPLIVVPKAAAPKTTEQKDTAPEKPAKKDKEPLSKRGATPAAGAPNVSELPIPKDATNVEFKKLVGHIAFETAVDHKSQAVALSKQLEALGWTTPDSDLIAAKSAILRRNKGGASLTIFVKPTDKGSKVTIMSEGLSWEEAKTVDAAAKPEAGR